MSEFELKWREFRSQIEPELAVERWVADEDAPSCYLRSHKPGVKRRRLQPALKGRRRTKYQAA